MNREWIKFVEQSIRELRQRTQHLPTRMRAGGSGAAPASWEPYVVELPEDLPASPPDGSLGTVTTGDYAGAWYTYYDGQWRGLNFWEIP